MTVIRRPVVRRRARAIDKRVARARLFAVPYKRRQNETPILKLSSRNGFPDSRARFRHVSTTKTIYARDRHTRSRSKSVTTFRTQFSENVRVTRSFTSRAISSSVLRATTPWVWCFHKFRRFLPTSGNRNKTFFFLENLVYIWLAVLSFGGERD